MCHIKGWFNSSDTNWEALQINRIELELVQMWCTEEICDAWGAGWRCQIEQSLKITSAIDHHMDKTEPHFQHQQHILNCALAVVTVYAQLVVLLMATLAPTEKADWNEVETTAFVEYLWEHKAEGGDGGGFKDVTFGGASMHIANLLSAGPVKTPKCCKMKWTSVCHWSVNCPDTNFMSYVQLKAIFCAIISFKENTLGMHWDDKNSANKSGDVSSSMFDNYVNSLKVCFRFLIIILCIYFIIQYNQTDSWSPFAIGAGRSLHWATCC